ncbi:MAG: formate dehydrogenase accessory protein FdhE [Candidatus Sericytochromatia bacterium]|nr:formate dehydrogenase accessory protein FdhE [Candidatus Sericytochromatia bacterium]
MLQYPTDAYERWKTAYPELQEQIGLIQVLQRVQQELLVTPLEVASQLSPEEITHALASGSSLAIVEALPVSDERWLTAFAEVVGAVVDHFPTEAGAQLLIQIQSNSVDVAMLMLDVLDQNLSHVATMAADLDIEPDTLSFYAAATLLPFLSAYAESVNQQLLQENWLQGYCPVCGREPLFSIAGDETRELFCHQCHSRWRSPPRQCVFCRDFTAHAYIEEPATGVEVEICRACFRFLRQVSDAQLQELDPALLDMLTAAAGAHVEAQGFR